MHNLTTCAASHHVTPEETHHGASRREMLATASVIASTFTGTRSPGRAGAAPASASRQGQTAQCRVCVTYSCVKHWRERVHTLRGRRNINSCTNDTYNDTYMLQIVQKQLFSIEVYNHTHYTRTLHRSPLTPRSAVTGHRAAYTPLTCGDLSEDYMIYL
jgi:hypothetical protein